MSTNPTLQLAVFDLAGTTVDFGCFSPVLPFVEAFAALGVAVSVAEARAPMGLSKRDHVAAMLATPAIAQRWSEAQGTLADDAAVAAVYEVFGPLQLAAAADHADLVPGVLSMQAALRARGVRIVTTTGYFRAAAEVVWRAMAAAGFEPDLNLCPDDVDGVGRPAPAMVAYASARFGVEQPERVIKVGDTVHDIAEGLNAGAWSLGVTHSGSDMGCTVSELAALDAKERATRLAEAEARLSAAGAHGVMPSVADLMPWVDTIEAWLAAGRRP